MTKNKEVVRDFYKCIVCGENVTTEIPGVFDVYEICPICVQQAFLHLLGRLRACEGCGMRYNSAMRECPKCSMGNPKFACLPDGTPIIVDEKIIGRRPKL